MYLCDDLLKYLFTYIDLRTLYKVVRRVNKQWFRVNDNAMIWQSVTLKGMEDEANSFLFTFRKKIKYLHVEGMTWSRRNTIILQEMPSLLALDLSCVFSMSMIDDRFCSIISSLKIRSLLLPKNNISDHGFSCLSSMRLQKLEMRMNTFITEAFLVFTLHEHFKGLRELTFNDVAAVRRESLLAIAEKKMRTVHLSFCRFVDDDAIRAFSCVKNCNLQSCMFFGLAISVKTMEFLFTNCPNINTFALHFQNHMSIASVQWENFPNINTLIFVCCDELQNLDFVEKSNIKNLFLCRTNLSMETGEQYRKMYRTLRDRQCHIKYIRDDSLN